MPKNKNEGKQLKPNLVQGLDHNDNTTPFNGNITLEVKAAIRSLTSQSKATGYDPISYHLIKHLGEEATKIVHSYQRCWTTEQIPKAWKTADVIGILKEGKPANLASSYCPIALTPHLGKLYERIVKERLQNHLDSKDVLP